MLFKWQIIVKSQPMAPNENFHTHFLHADQFQ